MIAACFTLHNICEMHGDTFDERLLEGVENDSGIHVPVTDVGASHSVSGENIRQALMAYF